MIVANLVNRLLMSAACIVVTFLACYAFDLSGTWFVGSVIGCLSHDAFETYKDFRESRRNDIA